MFVRNDCKVFKFCRSKCHNNFKQKRNPRKVRWTKAYRRSRGKELAHDSTFDFERKRNRPVRYDRTLVQKAIKAIDKVSEIRSARDSRFYAERMKGSKSNERKAAIREIRQNIDLIISPLARKKAQVNQLPVAQAAADFLAATGGDDAISTSKSNNSMDSEPINSSSTSPAGAIARRTRAKRKGGKTSSMNTD
jgi:large subunit ribosomal protein L24e